MKQIPSIDIDILFVVSQKMICCIVPHVAICHPFTIRHIPSFQFLLLNVYLKLNSSISKTNSELGMMPQAGKPPLP